MGGRVRNIFWVGFVTRVSVKSGLIFFEGWAIRDFGELFSVKTALIFCQCRVPFGKTRTIYRTEEVSVDKGLKCISRTIYRTIQDPHTNLLCGHLDGYLV